MREADQPPALLRDQRVHGFPRIVKSRPGRFGDPARQRRFALAAVKSVVSIPQDLPFGKVFGDGRTNGERGHGMMIGDHAAFTTFSRVCQVRVVCSLPKVFWSSVMNTGPFALGR